MSTPRESGASPPCDTSSSRRTCGHSLLGDSRAIQDLREEIDAVARRDCTVLLLGESGTGKELIARRIHLASRRAGMVFVPVDCTTLRDTLLESQLFGHIKGAFTGAERGSLGFFRSADNGTVLLDEIGELEPTTQSKLLRCLQERAVVPLGTSEAVPINVRVIAATHRDLDEMISKSEFRHDLYYRLNVVQIRVPPLRERKEDIPLLADHFLRRFSENYGEPMKAFASETIDRMIEYSWPGNVRELLNAVERACVLCRGDVIVPADLPESVRRAGPGATRGVAIEIPSIDQALRSLISMALKDTKGNQNAAARILKVNRKTLYRKVKQYGLEHLVADRR